MPRSAANYSQMVPHRINSENHGKGLCTKVGSWTMVSRQRTSIGKKKTFSNIKVIAQLSDKSLP